MRARFTCVLLALALVAGMVGAYGPPASATPPDNTPGGAQVGPIRGGTRTPPFNWNVGIEQTGTGPYTYTLRRKYDPDPILTTTGTGYFGSYTWYGDVWGSVSAGASSEQVRLWDATAKPAVLLMDETFGCTDSPVTEVSPNLRYVYFSLLCTVPGSGGNNTQRFIRIYDLGNTATGAALIYSRTLSNVACCTGATITWSGDFDEVILEWGVLDAVQSRYADAIDLDTGAHREWATGPLAASAGVTQWLQGFSPCGSSFVTYDTAYDGPTTTGVTYTLRSTADGAVLGSVAMHAVAIPPDSYYFPSLNSLTMAADGTVSGTYAGTTYTVGTDPTPCDASKASPVPVWPADPTGWHEYDFAGGRTLTWPAGLATDDHAVTGYDVYAYRGTGDDWTKIGSPTGTSLVLPASVPAVNSTFRVYALDAEGRRSVGLSGVPYYELDGTPGAVPTPHVVAGRPTVTGTRRVGSPLTVHPGTWTSGATLSYQWLANGAAISGATKVSFTPAAAQVGKSIAVRVTGTRSGYVPASASAVAGTTAKGTIIRATVKISGTATVGRKLTAKPGKWKAGTSKITFTYRWYANGKAIRSATRSTLTLTKAQRGRKIVVAVTGSAKGYVSTTGRSAATRAVR